ncbi:MAG: chitobiase/beta-hexosaminidase C-terminal domain-containing protein, partial [Planctomycetes bacterium]|nr:chitobiase/beta-hexosaminidase C-terminal domain-containing protein [Planctomycetota bacterium]
RDAPIVVHLADWSPQPEPFTVSLNPDVLFAGRPYRISLIQPKPYDRAAHEAAFDRRDYSSLVEQTTLASGLVTVCDVPVLRPWGLLVLSPLPAREGLWPPRFVSTDSQGTPAVGLSSPETNAMVRFTTDGSEPGPDSPLYREPVPLGSCREIRARAYVGDATSATSVLRHLPAAGGFAISLLKNGDFSQGTDHWRTVISKEIRPESLGFVAEKIDRLDNRFGARLDIKASDGVPYHLRLVQPLEVRAEADLYVTATLLADRPARVRFGIQERRAPFRVVHVGVLEIGPEPRRIRLSMTNPHPQLQTMANNYAAVLRQLGKDQERIRVELHDLAPEFF